MHIYKTPQDLNHSLPAHSQSQSLSPASHRRSEHGDGGANRVASFTASHPMGFPVGYSELFLPRLVLYALTLLGLLRRLATAALRLAGAAPDDGLAGAASSAAAGHPLIPDPRRDPVPSVSAMLIREILPVVRFDEIASGGGGEGEGPDSCAVCLYEFEGRQEIRRLRNCRHIFHRGCLDQWMDHDQQTCPLCRTPFVPSEMQEAFNERLWAAAGVPDYYGAGEYSLSPELEVAMAGL